MGASASARALFLGLDNAGKTAIVKRLETGEFVPTTPTASFNAASWKAKKITWQSWDVGGAEKVRSLQRHYYKYAQGLVFVVDATDKKRFDEARTELQKLLREDELKRFPLLIFANKSELPEAATDDELKSALELSSIPERRKWFLQRCSAADGSGLVAGMEWLRKALMELSTTEEAK